MSEPIPFVMTEQHYQRLLDCVSSVKKGQDKLEEKVEKLDGTVTEMRVMVAEKCITKEDQQRCQEVDFKDHAEIRRYIEAVDRKAELEIAAASKASADSLKAHVEADNAEKTRVIALAGLGGGILSFVVAMVYNYAKDHMMKGGSP